MKQFSLHVGLVVCVSALCLAASAEDQPTYFQNASRYTYGVVDRSDLSTSIVVPAEAALAFPDMTVGQLYTEDWNLYGYFCGGSLGAGYLGTRCEMYCVQVHRDAAEVIDKMIGFMTMYEPPYMKAVALEFTNGAGGVYVRQLKALYKRNETNRRFLFGTLQADGTVAYSGAATVYAPGGSATATGYSSGSYGVCGLTVLKNVLPDVRAPVWKHADGAPALTLDAIRDYEFHAFFTGGSVSGSGTLCDGYNTHLVWNDARTAVTAIRTEIQLLDDRYVKCVVVELTNGAEGIEMQALAVRYIPISSGGLGFRFVNPDGSFAGVANSVAPNSWSGGYGVYELSATPLPPRVELVLDADKTWSELVAGVDLGTRGQILEVHVVADHPTLTIDAAVDRATVNFTGTAAGTNSFALAFSDDFGGTFIVDSLGVGEGLTADLPLAYEPTALRLDLDSTVRYAATGEASVHSVIHGAGRVEVVSGTLTFTQVSDYTGGTLVRSGAVIRPGTRSVFVSGVLYFGAFGSSDEGSRIKLEPGARFDYAGQRDVSYYFELQGADPILNSRPETVCLDGDIAQAAGFVLADGLVLNMTNAVSQYAIVTPWFSSMSALLDLNGHTFVKNGTNTFDVRSRSLEIRNTGAIQINEGEICFGRGPAVGWNAMLGIAPGAVFTSRHNTYLKAVTNNGTIVLAPYDAAVTTNQFACRGVGLVRKIGGGTVRAPFTNGSGWLYQVESGTLQVQYREGVAGNPYEFVSTENPHANQHVVVWPGATFDLSDMTDLSVCVTLAGTGVDGKGAFINSGTTGISAHKFQTVQIILAGDASVGGASDFGLLAPLYSPTRLELGTNTLTIAKTARFWMVNTTVTGTGTLRVDRGILCACSGKPTQGASFTLDVGADGMVSNTCAMTVGTLRAAGPIKATTAVVVKHCVEAAGGEIERLALEDGAIIRVSDATRPLTVTQSLDLGATAVLDVADATLGDHDALPLLVPPAGWTNATVRYTVRNAAPGLSVTCRGGVPALVRSGLTFFVR